MVRRRRTARKKRDPATLNVKRDVSMRNATALRDVKITAVSVFPWISGVADREHPMPVPINAIKITGTVLTHAEIKSKL